jgi:hypothetical protein
MRKILLGISALVSLTFLASCGGGAGSSGSTGADGAAGTIAIPSAGALAITALVATNDGTSNSVDTTLTLGTVVRKFNISGAEAVPADGRLRYYVYEGTSATVKDDPWFDSLTYAGGDAVHTNGAKVNGFMDSRGITAGDNITVTTAGALNTATGAITHLIMCPGNEAGDAASCASVALNDRGWSALAQLTDNNTTELVMPVATSTGFKLIKGNLGSALLSSQDLSISIGSAAVLSGTAGSSIPAGKNRSGNLRGFDVFSNGGTTAYVMSLGAGDPDNFTLTSITDSGQTTVSYDNVTGMFAGLGAAGVRISGGADGLYTTFVHEDNKTLTAFRVDATGASWVGDNLTIGTNGADGSQTRTPAFCTAVNPLGGAMALAYAADNESLRSATLTGNTWANHTTLISSVYDSASSDNKSVDCDMVFSSLGTAWLVSVADNGTSFRTHSSADNGTTWSLAGTDNGSIASFSSDIDSISVAIDSQLNLPVVAVNVNGGLIALVGLDNSTGSYVWNTYKAEIAIALDGTKVELAASADGKQFMIGHEGVTGGTAGADNATITVFFD